MSTRFLLVFSLFVVCVFGRYVSHADNNNILSRCADGIQEFVDCLKYKTIKLLDRIIVDRKPIPLANYLYLTHDRSLNATENSILNDEEALKSGNVNNDLNEVLARRVQLLTAAKSLQIKLDADLERIEEGRKDKNKDKGGNMMMMLGAGAMMMHAAMSKIAFIAGKALIVAKIALVISAVVGLKKLLSQDEQHDSTQVIYKQAESGGHGGGGGGGGGWHRSIDDQAHAHQMAYNGQLHES